MKNRFKFIIIMVMAIVCTMTANAQKDVYFATHRFVQNEFGEISPKDFNDACCSARIVVDMGARTLLVATKTQGDESYTFSRFQKEKGNIYFFDEKDNKIAYMTFDKDFSALFLYRNDYSIVEYRKIHGHRSIIEYNEWITFLEKSWEKEAQQDYKYYY